MAFHLRFRNPEFYETKVMFHLYIDPLLDMIVIPTNILLIVVFVRGNFCSPSHVVLIAIALANIIQMLSTMVPSIYFYGLNFAEEFVPYAWCAMHNLLEIRIPKICTTLARLLTTLLGIQRYFIISFPITAKLKLTVRITLFIIISIIFVSILADFNFILNLQTIEEVFVNSSVIPGKLVSGCVWNERPQLEDANVIAEISTVFVPLASMIIFDAMIISILRKGKYLRQQTRLNRNIRKMVLVTSCIVTSVIIISVPNVTIKYFSQRALSQSFSVNKAQYTAIMKSVTILTYGTNFTIYSLLCKKFRTELKKFVCCRKGSSVPLVQCFTLHQNNMSLKGKSLTVAP